jgi:hypothetical protein
MGLLMLVEIENRLIPDPSMTDSEYYHQRAKNPTKPNIGKVYAQSNPLTRIGALWYIRRRQPHHEMVATMFKALYEGRYGTQGGGMDPSREPVDTSPIAHDSGMAAKIDRDRKIVDLERQIGKPAFRVLVKALILCAPVGEGLSSRPSQRAVAQFLDILDHVAELWQFKARKAA